MLRRNEMARTKSAFELTAVPRALQLSRAGVPLRALDALHSLLLALARRVEGDLLEIALDGELAVVDEKLAADAVLEEQEPQLVDGDRVLAVGAGLEVADRDRPGRQLIELLGVLYFRQLLV